jgi:hypothetical protein
VKPSRPKRNVACSANRTVSREPASGRACGAGLRRAAWCRLEAGGGRRRSRVVSLQRCRNVDPQGCLARSLADSPRPYARPATRTQRTHIQTNAADRALPGRWRALQAAWPRDTAVPRPVQADAGRIGAAGLGPLGAGAEGASGGVHCRPSIGASRSSRKNASKAARPVSPAFE